MTVYIDIIFLINFIIDFMLLCTVNVVLKRYTKLYKLLLGALFGSVSLLSLFIPINSYIFIFFKIIMALVMCLIAFGYKNIKYTFYNLVYLYMTSIILGGFLYYLKTEFSYSNDGLVFYYKGLTVNYIYLIVISPLILFLCIKSVNALKEIKNYYYKISIVFNNNYILNVSGFLDTGNKLVDPITNKPVILLNKKIIKGKVNIRSPMYVPYNSLNYHGIIECIKPKKIFVNNKEIKNYLIGLSNNTFKLNGIECLLNYKILEDIND